MFTETLLLFCSLIFLVIYVANSHPKNFPPGYLCFPILGHLPYIYKYRKKGPHLLFHEWCGQLGPIFSTNFASYPAVILSDYKSIREILGKNELSGVLSSIDSKGILGNSREDFAIQKMFILLQLKEKSQDIKSLVQTESKYLVENLKLSKSLPISMNRALESAVLNILWGFISGSRLTSEESEKLNRLIKRTSNKNPFDILTFLPFLGKMFPQLSGWNILKKDQENLQEFLKELIKKPKKSNAFIHLYLNEFGKNLQVAQKEMNLLQTMADILISSFEPMSSTLSWILILLAQHPADQNKAYKEINANFGEVLKNNLRLPYNEAIVKESLRLQPVNPLGQIRVTQDDIHIDKYIIPNNTILVPNIYSVHHDRIFWGENVDSFQPARFLDLSGQPEAFMPFSVGKRSCLGEEFALREIGRIIIHILQNFELTLNTNTHKNESSLSREKFEMVGNLCKATDHEIIFKPRS